ncbi:MAG: helix-turn-helix domain-containing protein [Lentisphaerae bacterium]|nr:helix-turn-helix domain-containing protein [Lentisphaerota bacterium]
MTKTGFIGAGNLYLDPPSLQVIQHSFLTMRESWNNPNRNAPFWRLYWDSTPGAEILFRDQTIELGPDKVVLIAPYISYASRATGEFTQFYMHFEWDVQLSPAEPLVFPAAPMRKMLNDVGEWYGRDNELFVVRMYSILLHYLAEMLNRNQPCPMRRTDPRIARAIELMDEDLHMNNEELARKVNLSCDNFQRLFRAGLGTTPCQYRLSRRMELAQHLLQDPERSLNEIAVETGFSNRYQFSKAFKKFFRIAPGASRKIRSFENGDGASESK